MITNSFAVGVNARTKVCTASLNEFSDTSQMDENYKPKVSIQRRSNHALGAIKLEEEYHGAKGSDWSHFWNPNARYGQNGDRKIEGVPWVS